MGDQYITSHEVAHDNNFDFRFVVLYRLLHLHPPWDSDGLLVRLRRCTSPLPSRRRWPLVECSQWVEAVSSQRISSHHFVYPLKSNSFMQHTSFKHPILPSFIFVANMCIDIVVEVPLFSSELGHKMAIVSPTSFQSDLEIFRLICQSN